MKTAAEMTNQELSAEVMRRQRVQMTHHMDTATWQQASAELEPLFAECAKRYEAGDVVGLESL